MRVKWNGDNTDKTSTDKNGVTFQKGSWTEVPEGQRDAFSKDNTFTIDSAQGTPVQGGQAPLAKPF